ncbi:hypothetical protein SYNPS1DRAFT_32219 [Syncephalis pseudoplumigaleata]|uniref:Uncharacterized protein n=1 Tax=Syncephalis pseudoplumigaleata TaxID=1712513 RepID=A0A4P9YQW7_9FUNG|nr:hypothetical protein SYNPS1DRAFT_32219 [Syncephalis pseudoplumigaleata]|eukprot:RKP22216.1 hypothetical protein SYNPS1DRAFT_32219 [Syncephalis pseudoplumigaleata]
MVYAMLYPATGSSMGYDVHGQFTQAASQYQFWALILLTSTIVLMPEIIVRTLKTSWFPSDVTLFQQMEYEERRQQRSSSSKKQKDVDEEASPERIPPPIEHHLYSSSMIIIKENSYVVLNIWIVQTLLLLPIVRHARTLMTMNAIEVLQPDGTIRRYSEHHLRGVLQFLGCKQGHVPAMAATILEKAHTDMLSGRADETDGGAAAATASAASPSDSACSIRREHFEQSIQMVLADWHYYPLSRYHQRLAWSVRNRERGICILLGGTSGCGKSTLASLLASRFISEEENPVLWASSYHAGELSTDNSNNSNNDGGGGTTTEARVIHGYQCQTDVIYPQLRETVRRLLGRNESVIIEGVHLSVEVMLQLATEFAMCLPFVIYINKQAKHAERFATRAKYMTLEPRFNKYMKYFENIRMIQSHLCREADVHLVRVPPAM